MSDLKRKSPPEIEEPNKRSSGSYQKGHDAFLRNGELCEKIYASLDSQGNRDDDDKA
ncbi:hypothetical protein H0H93_004825, partial [Arthromyces matolae]